MGILQTEADNIDEYICPNCQGNSSINYANMKELNQKDFEGLKKLIKQLQVRGVVTFFFVFFNKNFIFSYIKAHGLSWNL